MRNFLIFVFSAVCALGQSGQTVTLSLGGHDCAECAINLPKAIATSCEGMTSAERSRFSELLGKNIRKQKMSPSETADLKAFGSKYLEVQTLDKPEKGEMITRLLVQPACGLNKKSLEQAFKNANRPVKAMR